MKENTQLQEAKPQEQETPFAIETTCGSLMLAGGEAFAHIQRVAKLFSVSSLIPDTFKGNLANCTIALEMAHRMGANPMAVMQNLYIVHGKPGWSSQFVIACLNQCGKFSPIRFRIIGDGEQKTCTAWAKELESGETLEGPPVSIQMAKDEGWHGKAGSKWKTMPDLMLRYRAASFFGRLYAPDLLMGMQTREEVEESTIRDIPAATIPLFSVPTNSPSETGAAGLGGSAVSHDAAPAGVARSRQTKPSVKDSPPLVLNGDAPTLREQVAGKMKVAGLEWLRVATAAEQGGLFVDPSFPLVDTPDEVLRDILAAWDNLAPLAKEVTQ